MEKIGDEQIVNKYSFDNDDEKIIIKNNNAINDNSAKLDDQKNFTCYYTDLSKFKSKKICGITFYKVGNIYIFGFVKGSHEPLFSMDSKWYLHLIIFSIVFIIYYTGNKFLFCKFENWKQIIFNVILSLFLIFYFLLTFINPGVVIHSKKGLYGSLSCTKCNIYYLPQDKVTHCSSCGVCMRNLDHHCSVFRRCITKRNIILFFGIIFLFIALYVYSLIFIILFCVNFVSKKRGRRNNN